MKSWTAGLILTLAGAAMAVPPSAGFNHTYRLSEVRYETGVNSHCILFTAYAPNDATMYVFRYFWSPTGTGAWGGNNNTTFGYGTVEDAKMLFSALSLARSLNKNINFTTDGYKKNNESYEFRSIGVMP